MNEAIQVSCIIDKLPPSWKDFKHTLKHNKDELTLVELDSHLCIEESLGAQDSDKPKGNNVVGLKKFFVSSSILNNYDYNQVIESSKFVLSKHGVFIGFGYLSNQMFGLNIVNDNIGSAFMSTSKLNDSILWHARLGHVQYKRMQDISKDGLFHAFDMDTKKCKTCMLTKITKKLYQNVKRETEVLELIHSYLCDLHATPSLGNKKYFVTFIDDAFRFCYVCLLHTKDEALDKFKVFKTKVELQQGALIKRFTTDKGGLSQGFCGEAMLIACYLLNRVPNKRNRITPYELWTKRKPNLNYLRVWGCRAVVRLPDLKLKTLGKRGVECIFVGYAEHSKAFRFSLVPRPNLRIPNRTEDISGSVVPKEVTEEVDGTIEKFKATLVIQGFRKKSRIVYFDTYAPVARISTIRLLIAMASIHNLIIHQMDVKMDFLNGKLDEDVYMNQPQGFIMPANGNKVDLTKEFLSSKFSMKDMGEADVILGIRIKHESNGIAISQSHYIEKVVSQLEYSMVIGCLMYGMTCTRPDIAFALGKQSRYTSNSGTQHWQAFKKQTCITGSTMESEFMALPPTGKEAECATTLAKAYSQMYNGKSRHLGVRHSMIRELIMNGVVCIEFVRSQRNLVDHLTKGLAMDLVLKSTEGIGLKSNLVTEC
ncbi:zinc finger, CCHC-type containing protein [Tanacetum coccineum]